MLRVSPTRGAVAGLRAPPGAADGRVVERLGKASAAGPELWRAFCVEMARSTRETGLLGGALLLVAFPLWSIFDRVHEPDHAAAFFVVRVVVEVAALGVWVLLCSRRFGTRFA